MMAHLSRPQKLLVQHADVSQRLGGRGEERDVHPAGPAAIRRAAISACSLASGEVLCCAAAFDSGCACCSPPAQGKLFLSPNALSALWVGLCMLLTWLFHDKSRHSQARYKA